MVYQKKKSVSPLIATILLIVVAVVLVIAVLSFSKDFVGESLEETKIFYQQSNLTGFVTSQGNFGHLVTIANNHRTLDANIIGYQIKPALSHHLYKYFEDNVFYLENSVLLSPNSTQTISIDCFPENNVTISLITDDNKYIDVRVNVTDLLPTSDHFCKPILIGGNVSEIEVNGIIYNVHIFDNVGLNSLQAFVPSDFKIDILIVAGGGGGGAVSGGGGGAGGLIFEENFIITFGDHSVFVGNGGIGGIDQHTRGSNGDDSYFNDLVAIGGGGGGSITNRTGLDGGSGGGANSRPSAQGGVALNSGLQGNDGGYANGSNSTSSGSGSGGGGFSESGYDTPNEWDAADGGAGWNGINYFGTDFGDNGWFAGGGGGGYSNHSNGNEYERSRGDGGQGGGGNGSTASTNGQNGLNNTGSGGGGGGYNGGNFTGGNGGKGGSGIIIIRYPK
jgi:flagellin-like protein